MNWNKFKIKTEIKALLLMLMAFVTIAFVEKKHDMKTCQEIDIYIHNTGNDFFLNKEVVYKLITANESDFIIGTSYERIDLRSIETRINQNEYVENAQAYIDLTGKLTVDVYMNKPIARILSNSDKDHYLCDNDQLIKTSEIYTSRVLLVNGDYFRSRRMSSLTTDSTFTQIKELLHFIDQDAFWKAQIAQVIVEKNGDIRFLPQVTKQVIEFGKAENIEKKFIKLKYFYKRILPEKGWNTYARVNVEYEDQIICE